MFPANGQAVSIKRMRDGGEQRVINWPTPQRLEKSAPQPRWRAGMWSSNDLWCGRELESGLHLSRDSRFAAPLIKGTVFGHRYGIEALFQPWV